MGSEALMAPVGRRSSRWGDTWLRSDLVSIPLLVGLLAIVVVLIALFLLIGDAGGIFVDKLLFPIALGALLLAFLLLIAGRRGEESTEGVQVAPAGLPRRVLVIANRGLESEAHWEDAERFAERVRDEVGIRVTEVYP